MSTKAGTMRVSARPAALTLWAAAVSALAVTALVMSAVALNVATRGADPVTSAAPRESAVSGSVISGTGPGLVRVGEEAARTATFPRIYSGSAVTGTGPGLATLTQGVRVTGTGPGLVRVAERS
jgi:hypothetical protein